MLAFNTINFYLLLLKDDQVGMDLSRFLTTSIPIATKINSNIHVINDQTKDPTAYKIPILLILEFQISELLDSTIIVNAGNTRNIPRIIKNQPNHSGIECLWLITNCVPTFQSMLLI